MSTPTERTPPEYRELQALYERDRWREDAWQCFKASGADCSGDDARHLNLGEAPREVERLRKDYQESLDAGIDWENRALRAESDLEQLLEAVRGHGEPESWYWQDNKRLYQVADEIERSKEEER